MPFRRGGCGLWAGLVSHLDIFATIGSPTCGCRSTSSPLSFSLTSLPAGCSERQGFDVFCHRRRLLSSIYNTSLDVVCLRLADLAGQENRAGISRPHHAL
jgi:hypothetical protein